MSRKIKLPERFDLCTDSALSDGTNGRQWKTVEIFKNLIEQAEASPHHPQFTKVGATVTRLPAEFLSAPGYSGDSIRYGRTVVYQDIAIKMQKKCPGFCLFTQSGDDDLLLPDRFYISTINVHESILQLAPNATRIKYTYVSIDREQKEHDFLIAFDLPLPVPLTQAAFVANLDKIKKTVLEEAIRQEHISHFYREDERPELLSNEHIMQRILSQDRSLKSAIPDPVGFGYDSTTERYFCAYRIPEGYYTYLSEILNTETFIDSASRAAHDLGYLLRRGYVFQNLISVFHDKYRPYTLLPDTTFVAAGRYGGFPGKIVNIIGQNLYENIGQSGLRDLGDLEFITDFRFYDSHSREKNAPVSLKIAHFISLYLMVFTILIGNRSRNLEVNNLGVDHWANNNLIYSQILQALFRGLDIPLSEKELFYIDPSKIKAQKSEGATRLMQPGEKFNEQLRAWFTTAHCINDEIATAETEVRLQREVYGSKKASYARVEFGLRNEEQYMQDFDVRGMPRMVYNKRDQLWKSHPGCLGQSPSGINPLTTAVKYALRAAQLGVEKVYQLSNTDGLTQPMAETQPVARNEAAPINNSDQSLALAPTGSTSSVGENRHQFFVRPTARVISSMETHGRASGVGCSVS